MITLGIDFGGTGIKGALVDCTHGEMITERLRISTPGMAKPDDVADIIQRMVQKNQWTGRIGLGFPAVIKDGYALNSANISKKWIGMDVSEFITRYTGCETFILNDADAAGLAEITFGAGQEPSNKVILMLTVGTGIGTSIFSDGHMLPNSEFGHLNIRGKDAEKRISDVVRRDNHLSWKKWSKRFQEFLDEMEKLINPDVIIIGGGVSKYYQEFRGYLKTKGELIPAHYLNHAGIIGAGLYASRQSEKK